MSRGSSSMKLEGKKLLFDVIKACETVSSTGTMQSITRLSGRLFRTVWRPSKPRPNNSLATSAEMQQFYVEHSAPWLYVRTANQLSGFGTHFSDLRQTGWREIAPRPYSIPVLWRAECRSGFRMRCHCQSVEFHSGARRSHLFRRRPITSRAAGKCEHSVLPIPGPSQR